MSYNAYDYKLDQEKNKLTQMENFEQLEDMGFVDYDFESKFNAKAYNELEDEIAVKYGAKDITVAEKQ